VTVTFGEPLVFERKDAEGRKTDYEAVSRAMMAAIGRLAEPATARAVDRKHLTAIAVKR
jgi:hypothetical protein